MRRLKLRALSGASPLSKHMGDSPGYSVTLRSGRLRRLRALVTHLESLGETALPPGDAVSVDVSLNDLKSLSELGEFEMFGRLVSLTASINYLPDLAVETLPVLDSLVELVLDNNAIGSMNGLSGRFPLLEKLSLAGNSIDYICGLDAMASLKILNLGSNEIAQVEGLGPVADSLTELRVAGNNLARVDGIVFLEQLTVLDIADNVIEDLGETAGLLRALPRLEEVHGAGNPFAATATYKAVFLESAPLRIIDGHAVTPLFREQMARAGQEASLSELVADTTDAYLTRIEQAREAKAAKLRALRKRENDLESSFAAYEAHLASEMNSLTRYVHDVLASSGRTDIDIKEMRTVLAATEASRWKEVLDMLQDDQDAWEAEVLRARNETPYTDKLRELAMAAPDEWRTLKIKEHELVTREARVAAKAAAESAAAAKSANMAADYRRGYTVYEGSRRDASAIHEVLDNAHRGNDEHPVQQRRIVDDSERASRRNIHNAAASQIQGHWRSRSSRKSSGRRSRNVSRSNSRRASRSVSRSVSRRSSRRSSRAAAQSIGSIDSEFASSGDDVFDVDGFDGDAGVSGIDAQDFGGDQEPAAAQATDSGDGAGVDDGSGKKKKSKTCVIS